MRPHTKESVLETLKRKTSYLFDCWLIVGINDHSKIKYEGRNVFIHRLSAHLHWGFDLDSPNLILHKTICNNQNCWNPDHLYEGTAKDNTRDSIEMGTFFPAKKKTHCRVGHELTENNVIVDKQGQRRCKICRNENRMARGDNPYK